VKTVPVAALPRAARSGIGLSPVFAVSQVDDAFTATDAVGGPTGDLRLMPDLSALRVPSGSPGWAWAPADQYTQDGEPFSCCQRSFLRRVVEQARGRGLELRFGCELEFFLGNEEDGVVIPANDGPAYGFAALADVSECARELLAAFADAGIELGQLHPEYGAGQLELSLPATNPVGAADLAVVARPLIRAVAARHGWRASFSPVVVPDQIGNGGHLHFSVWHDGQNLFAAGDGPHGMTRAGEAFIAGVLGELPALMAVGAPSVASYLRMRPSHWAGAYACWGRENREAALRFITGSAGGEQEAATCEIKCFDLTANPYLAIGSVVACGLAGMDLERRLPDEVLDDPAAHTQEDLAARGIDRLPTTLELSLAQLRGSKVLREAMGPTLFGAFTAVRRGEWEAFGEDDPERIAAAHRWRY
jgi:glutamine synthetase